MTVATAFAKDCDCVCHIGPHWLYVDDLDRERTREMISRLKSTTDPGTHAALVHYIATWEKQRCQEKRQNMERRGIREIPAELTAAAAEFRERWRASNLRRWLREKRREAAALDGRLAALAAEYDDPTGCAEHRRAAIRDEVDSLQPRIAALREQFAAQRATDGAA